jgi:hypothetical protein
VTVAADAVHDDVETTSACRADVGRTGWTALSAAAAADGMSATSANATVDATAFARPGRVAFVRTPPGVNPRRPIGLILDRLAVIRLRMTSAQDE